MKRIHLALVGKIACRRSEIQTDNWITTDKVPEITCIPCKKAIGLSVNVFSAKIPTASCVIALGRKTASVPVADVEMLVTNIQRYDTEDAETMKQMLSHSPPIEECVKFKLRIDESGRQAIYNLLFK